MLKCTTLAGWLSDSQGKLKFTEGLDTVNHVLAEGEQVRAIEVPVQTVDNLVGSYVPVLIKIDVEGYERSVVLGAGGTLADPPGACRLDGNQWQRRPLRRR